MTELQSGINGKVTTATDPEYEDLRRGLIWNQLTPTRYPQLIVQVATEHDVVEAVRFARIHRMKIAVRGGGHCQTAAERGGADDFLRACATRPR